LYLSKEINSATTLKYQTSERKDHWMVMYSPKDSSVRGGGGELRVEKDTGKVSFVVGYR